MPSRENPFAPDAPNTNNNAEISKSQTLYNILHYIIHYMNSSAASSQIYQSRYNLYRRAIQEGRIRSTILFPDVLATYSIHDVRNLAFNPENVRILVDTLSFLGIDFGPDLPSNIRLFLLHMRMNPVVKPLLDEYRRRINNDALFFAFLNKAIEFRNEFELQSFSVSNSDQSEDDQSEGLIYQSNSSSLSEEDESLESGEDQTVESEEYVIPDTLVSKRIEKSDAPIIIQPTDTGFDPIEGERSVIEHMEESPDHLVFVIITKQGYHSYYLSSKEQLTHLIKDRSNIHYVCKKHSPSMLYVAKNDVIHEKPLFKLTSIGITTPYVYLDQIMSVLESPLQVYQISDEPLEKAIAVASDDVLGGRNMASGAHCQHVEGDSEYPIYSLLSKVVVVDKDKATEATDEATDEATEATEEAKSKTEEPPEEEDAPPKKRIRAGTKTKSKKNKKTKKSKTKMMSKKIGTRKNNSFNKKTHKKTKRRSKSHTKTRVKKPSRK